MKCTSCGYENPDGAMFCKACGAMLNMSQPADANAPQPVETVTNEAKPESVQIPQPVPEAAQPNSEASQPVPETAQPISETDSSEIDYEEGTSILTSENDFSNRLNASKGFDSVDVNANGPAKEQFSQPMSNPSKDNRPLQNQEKFNQPASPWQNAQGSAGQNQFGQPGQNQFGSQPANPWQNAQGSADQNQFGSQPSNPWQNAQGSAGQNQFGQPGQNQFGSQPANPWQNAQGSAGQNQFGQQGQNQFGSQPASPWQNAQGGGDQSQFGQSSQNQFGQPVQNQFGGQPASPWQNAQGGGDQSQFGQPSQNQFGQPNQNQFGGQPANPWQNGQFGQPIQPDNTPRDQYGQPIKNKKSKKPLIIGLIAVAVLAVLACVYFFVLPMFSKGGAKKATKAGVDNIVKVDLKAMLDTTKDIPTAAYTAFYDVVDDNGGTYLFDLLIDEDVSNGKDLKNLVDKVINECADEDTLEMLEERLTSTEELTDLVKGAKVKVGATHKLKNTEQVIDSIKEDINGNLDELFKYAKSLDPDLEDDELKDTKKEVKEAFNEIKDSPYYDDVIKAGDSFIKKAEDACLVDVTITYKNYTFKIQDICLKFDGKWVSVLGNLPSMYMIPTMASYYDHVE